MKKIYILIILLHSNIIIAQDWEHQYPEFNNSYASGLVESYDKGYLFLLIDLQNGQGKHSFIVKSDINGNKLWSITVGDGIHLFQSESIDITNDHGFIVCGETDKFGGSNPDPFLLKFNSCGDLEWCRVIYTPGIYDFSIRARQTTDNNFLLLSYSLLYHSKI